MAFSIGEGVAYEVGAEAAIDAAAVEAGASAAAAYEGTAASTYAAAAAGGGVMAAVGSALANFAISTLASRLLAPKIGGRTETGQGALINTLSSTDPIPVIYGSRRVGATVCPLGVSGQYSQFLHVLAIWGEGPISAINQLYLDGVAITDGRFSGWVTVEHHLGADNQAASAALIAAFGDASKWNASCTLAGVAYSYLVLTWINGLWRGKPLITADLDGRTLYDPRTALTAFSRNPWLAVRDYLTNTRYGRAFDPSLIDDTTFQSEANHADVLVAIPTGGTQARYTCDGVVNIDDNPMDITRSLLTSCRGTLDFSGGKYKAKSDKARAQTTFVLNEDNIVGGWSFELPDTRTRFNRVKARFYDAANQYQPNIAVWPPANSATFATYLAQDAGFVLETQLELPFTRDLYTAQQIAQIECKKSRSAILVSALATIAAHELEVADVVPMKHTTPGWPAAGDPAEGKLFDVIELELLANDEVRVGLQSYDVSAYTLDALTVVSALANTSLPDIAIVGVPGAPTILESQYQTANSAGVKNRATVSWGAAPDVFVQNGGWYQLERSAAGAGSWTVYPRIQSTGAGTITYVVDDVPAGNYDWRVSAFNTLARQSGYATTTKEILGLNAAPSNVANFAVQAYQGTAKFTWDKMLPATDLATLVAGRIFVRWSPLTVGANWNNGSLVNPDGYPGDTAIGYGPLMAGTYMAKAWNGKTFSVTETSFVATESLLTGLTTLATLTEHPTFPGAKTNVAAVDGALKLDGTTLWDSIPGSIDSWGNVDTIGGVQLSGSYAFSGKLDLASVKTFKLSSTIRSVAFDTADNWDDRTTNIDDWGLIDGSVIDDAEAKLSVRVTNDDPAGSPTWGPWHALGLVGDYTARAVDARLDFTTANPTHNRQVDQLVLTARQ